MITKSAVWTPAPVLALAAALFALSSCTGNVSNRDANASKDTSVKSPVDRLSTHRMPSPSATAVFIQPGTTSSVFENRLEAGKDAEYVIGAPKGAFVVASVVGFQHDLAVSVHRADTGAEIEDLTPDHSFWVGRVPESIGYLVVVHGSGEPTDYSLTIGIPRELVFDKLPSGLDVSSVDVPPSGIVSYVLPPSEKVEAELTAAPSGAFLTLHHIEGATLVKAAENKRKFSIVERSNEELVLRFHQPNASGAFRLRIRLE